MEMGMGIDGTGTAVILCILFFVRAGKWCSSEVDMTG
jgi:hypothetical protein